MLRNYLFVALGGMVGSVLRYAASQLIRPSHFPWATLTVNVIGSLIIGLVVGYYNRPGTDDAMRLLLATGLCGGFTTYSAFSTENVQLLQGGHYSTALSYIAATLLLGFGATAAGFILTKN